MSFRLGMLGMWHTHAHGIVQQVAAHPKEFTLVGFYDRDEKVVRDRRRRWLPLLKNVPIFKSPKELLKEKLDGVVVEGRITENLELARLVLESGRPVLLEKPAGTNLKEFQQLIDLAQKKHLHVQMLYLFRYMPAVQRMFDQGRKKELGDIYHFRARLPKPLSEYDQFVEELAPYKGGMFFEMAGHIIDMMVTLLGQPRRVTPFLAHHHRRGPKNYIDNGVGIFEYDNAWGIIEVPALEVAPRSRRIEVFGTGGACVIPHLGSGHLENEKVQRIELYRAGQADWQVLNLKEQPLQITDLREFAAVAGGKRRPAFSIEHDLTVQEMLLRSSGMMGR